MNPAAPHGIDTGFPGFRFWPGLLSTAEQSDLRDTVLLALETAPFYRPVTRSGRPFSVEMSNLGPLGWVSDRAGYRYQPNHPVTDAAWPPMPAMLIGMWTALTGWPEPPDACLVNLYRAGAKMGMHQDRDEEDLTAPVLSISLGDAAIFRIGASDGGPTRSFRLASGDVCALTGPARMARHGVDRIVAGSSAMISGGGRLNLTLRKVVALPERA